MAMDASKHTGDVYSFLWLRKGRPPLPARWHFDAMQEAVQVPIVRGRAGIEVGCGCGYDTRIMAMANPSVRIVGLDISAGVYQAREITRALGNVSLIQSSALSIPARDATFDFAYSFGVLHHTDDPEKGLMEIRRVLKKDSPVFLYLYEDHSGDILKYMAVKAVAAFRRLTTRLPRIVLYAVSWLVAPFVYIAFTLPSKAMRLSKATRRAAGRMPFNFARTPFSLRRDLYDRFGAPIEHRFSRRELGEVLVRNGFRRIKIKRMRDTAGWVAWGYKG